MEEGRNNLPKRNESDLMEFKGTQCPKEEQNTSYIKKRKPPRFITTLGKKSCKS